MRSSRPESGSPVASYDWGQVQYSSGFYGMLPDGSGSLLESVLPNTYSNVIINAFFRPIRGADTQTGYGIGVAAPLAARRLCVPIWNSGLIYSNVAELTTAVAYEDSNRRRPARATRGVIDPSHISPATGSNIEHPRARDIRHYVGNP